MKIAIDIGHGTDTKGKGIADFKEHWFNSEVGIIVKNKLLEYNCEVYFTQPPHSKEVPLRTRINQLNKDLPDLIWSIHANANGNPDVNGACCFFWGGTGIANLYVNNLDKYGVTKHGNGRHPYKNGTWTDLAMIEDTKSLSILTELGFFTNPEELKLLKSKEYQEKVANIIVFTIVEYLSLKQNTTNYQTMYETEHAKVLELESKLAQIESIIKE